MFLLCIVTEINYIFHCLGLLCGGHEQTHTSQSSALTIRDLSVKLINGYFNVWFTLGDGALQVLLNVRQELEFQG